MDRTVPCRESVAALAARLGAWAIVPDSDSETAQFLGRAPADGIPARPILVARPECARHVQDAVRGANDLALTVSVVGGSHSPYGWGGQLVLDLQRFDSVEVDVDASCVTIGGGATMEKLVDAAAEHDLMVPTGTAPTVGPGLILQGGVGHLSRLLGLTLDSILSAEVVVADGRILTVSPEHHAELFWALRGCGPNFAVVLAITLKAYPLRTCIKTDVVLKVSGQEAAASKLLLDYASRACALPRSASSDCIIFFDGASELQLGVFDYGFDGSQVDGSPGFSSDAECVRSSTSRELTPVQIMRLEPYLHVQPEGTLTACGEEGLGFYVRVIFLAAPFAEETARFLLRRLREAPCTGCYYHFQHCGGAVDDRSADETAFAARRVEWSLVITGCWPKPDRSDLESRCKEWVFHTVDALLPTCLGTYSTDLGPDDVHLAGFAFGANRKRLVNLKREWDPRNMFCHGFPLLTAADPESMLEKNGGCSIL